MVHVLRYNFARRAEHWDLNVSTAFPHLKGAYCDHVLIFPQKLIAAA